MTTQPTRAPMLSGTTMQDRLPLLVTAVALLALPLLMQAIGLSVTSATEVVIFAIACMALNILVGHTGLVSFGHGAWFGLAAYAAGLIQRNLFPDGFILPCCWRSPSSSCCRVVFGILILRRRGVYFSLLTLALSAMLYAIAFRWTEVTGGENGLGGITRPTFAGVSFDNRIAYYVLVAVIGFGVVYFLWRFHRSPPATCWSRSARTRRAPASSATRRSRYKLLAFVISATLTGLAGVLLLFNNRMTSADPISVPFSGELLAMVIIGGMRSFLGPALGALFSRVPRLPVERDRELAALFRPAVRRLHRVLADRSRRRRRARAAAVPESRGAGRGDGGAPGRCDRAAGLPQAIARMRPVPSSTSARSPRASAASGRYAVSASPSRIARCTR